MLKERKEGKVREKEGERNKLLGFSKSWAVWELETLSWFSEECWARTRSRVSGLPSFSAFPFAGGVMPRISLETLKPEGWLLSYLFFYCLSVSPVHSLSRGRRVKRPRRGSALPASVADPPGRGQTGRTRPLLTTQETREFLRYEVVSSHKARKTPLRNFKHRVSSLKGFSPSFPPLP